MHVGIIIPCLNEESALEATCASLGFGRAGLDVPENTDLFLVDNGSTDRTHDVIAAIAARSPCGSVHALQESERGYVPPRVTGVLAASSLALERDLDPNDILIIQADADTVYGAGYIGYMRDAAERAGANIMLEAQVVPPANFVADHPIFEELAERADRTTERLWAPVTHDVIVDDKAAAYRLSDYIAWGGLKREYTVNGDEIHAETTRLFIRAKATGASLISVPEAIACPSRRKLFVEAALHFATAGFPREVSWRASFLKAYPELEDLQGFEGADEQSIRKLTSIRQAHCLVLFAVLPCYVARTLGIETNSWPAAHTVELLVSRLPPAVRGTVVTSPGQMLMSALSTIELWPNELRRLV